MDYEDDDGISDAAWEEMQRTGRADGAGGAGTAEICACAPRGYDDVRAIIAAMRERKRVVLSLENLPEADRQRVMDTVTGAALALNDKLMAVSAGAWLITRDDDVVDGAPDTMGE